MIDNTIQYEQFDDVSTGRPYMMVPKVFGDNRGTFSEVLVDENGMPEMKQINRSTSCTKTFRGFHAQAGKYCQSKLVEAVTVPIIDIIIDARPDSKSFGLCEAFLLDPKKQNKLYVPRGFLHSIYVPEWDDEEFKSDSAVLMYYCDNVYDKETGGLTISPKSVISKLVESFKDVDDDKDNFMLNLSKMLEDSSNIVLSDKDSKGVDYTTFMEKILQEYRESQVLWYKD